MVFPSIRITLVINAVVNRLFQAVQFIRNLFIGLGMVNHHMIERHFQNAVPALYSGKPALYEHHAPAPYPACIFAGSWIILALMDNVTYCILRLTVITADFEGLIAVDPLAEVE
jgi:hypothetical protein